ncbi:MAG: polymer-forming cytoskeletal protein [Pseudomonadales bacterium]|jgi:cytoskeletal protein CcmA (bactofilin family)|nr:polymer-forming cytoskeletal protein [Pseudomonadales bacterium]
MFGDKDRNVKSAPTTKEAAVPGKGATLIANNTRLEGDIHFSDQLLVNGEVHGNVHAKDDSDAGLTVSAKGSVVGEIRVPNVVVNGQVKGDIYASKHVELAAEARVEGNVYYHLIEMVMGARVDGSLVYSPPGEEPGRKSGSKASAKGGSSPQPTAASAEVGNAKS